MIGYEIMRVRVKFVIELTGAKNENNGMASSSSIGRVPSESAGKKTFLTTGIGPCTSYRPNLWLNVASPKSEPGARAVI